MSPKPKNGVNEQWGLASSDGTRATAGAPFPPLPNGYGGPPLVDADGVQWVRVIGAAPAPGFATPWQENGAGVGLVNAALIRGGSQFLLSQVSGFVAAAAETDVNFVQLFDLTALPIGAAQAVQSIRVVGSQEWSWNPERYRFADGIVIGLSSTPIAYTASAGTLFYNALGWEP